MQIIPYLTNQPVKMQREILLKQHIYTPLFHNNYLEHLNNFIFYDVTSGLSSSVPRGFVYEFMIHKSCGISEVKHGLQY